MEVVSQMTDLNTEGGLKWRGLKLQGLLYHLYNFIPAHGGNGLYLGVTTTTSELRIQNKPFPVVPKQHFQCKVVLQINWPDN